MRIFATTLLILLFAGHLAGQTKQRKLGPALNNPSTNYWAPFISFDGSAIIFYCDYTEDQQPAPFLSLRQGVDWKEPVLIPRKFVANTYGRASTLSPDGKNLYLATKTNSTGGGFDISYTSYDGKTFGELVGLGSPINSSAHEGAPTFTPDGNVIYFMRCGTMSATGASDCKIFYTKKRNGLWEPPTELPGVINAGNSQMPRILGDGQTLIFASDRHTPSKGGMDLYMSRMENGQWSQPVNLEFVNTAGDDHFASVTSTSLSLVKDAKGDKRNELIEFTFPPELKPKVVVRVMGAIDGLADLTKAMVSIVNLETKQPIAYPKADSKGNFLAYVPEGSLYGLYVEAPSDNFRYFVKRYDFTAGNKIPNFDRVTASLKPLAPGDDLELSGVSFVPNSSDLAPTSIIDLQKTAKLIKGNPALRFTVDVAFYGLEKDSIQRDGLTETMPDTVVYEKEFQVDSVTTEMRDSIAIETLYHNDRTQKQAQAIADFLTMQGVKSGQISLSYKAFEEAVADKRRTVIYLRAR